ncbi:hypothetical protein [Mycoplasma seminis]|uniref:ECF transporter S component n=1 Tax=Mycoplasma seminis TaxID=512749 RepID=A0ABY9HAK5_9MOLU|nr:hypothetical protein [Mycoplasma seminis]WLP85625.1 hypothetical protein Q8852_00470 [Mycoplasma seminis]
MKQKKKAKLNVQTIVWLALYLAIIIMFTFTPYTGYITIGIISITTIPLIILIASIHLGYLGILWTSFNFGLWSYLGSIILHFPLFNNPLISFLPRVILGLVLCLFYWLLFKKWRFNIYSVGIYAFLIFTFNTLLVSIMVFIIIQFTTLENIPNPYAWFMLIWLNMIVEWGVLEVISLGLYPFLKWIWNKNQELIYNKINYE